MFPCHFFYFCVQTMSRLLLRVIYGLITIGDGAIKVYKKLTLLLSELKDHILSVSRKAFTVFLWSVKKDYKILKDNMNTALKKIVVSLHSTATSLGVFARGIRMFFNSFRAKLRGFRFKPRINLSHNRDSIKRYHMFSFMKRFRKKRRVGRPSKRVVQKSYMPFAYKLRLFTFGMLFSFFFLFLPIIFFIFTSDLPDPYKLSANSIPKTTKIYDRNGTLLYEIYANQNRTIIKLPQVPLYLRQATIAIEDQDFYFHPGFDIRGIARAAYSNLVNDDLQGGSTITQQLIKSALLSPSPTIQRKVKELVLAFWTERVYTKNEILELYFNYVPYGGTAWGVEAASEVYFGKKAEDLTLAQATFLAGMPKAPTIYSPYSGDDNRWKKRQREVLNAMVRDGYITRAVADKTYKEKLTFRPAKVPIRAPHFVMYVREKLEEKYGLSEVERGGLVVRTTLDLPLQEKVEEIVADQVRKDAYLNISNGAAVVTDPQTGAILAMVGSRDYYDSDNDGNVNVVTRKRQPGSVIKLITYTLALSSGFTEASILDDTPLSLRLSDGRMYTPVNYDGAFHGKQPLRNAFANSYNIPAVRLANQLGVDNIVKLGRSMGILSWDESNQYGVSITLGGAETTMLELATAYGTIANEGKRIDTEPFIQIKNAEGDSIYSQPTQGTQVVDSGIAFIISNILADNNARSAAFGPNSPLIIPNHFVSVKTGTSDEKKDNWTVGFTPHFVVATWVGNNDSTPMSQNLVSGITGAAPMWNKIMTLILNGKQMDLPPVPANIVRKSCFGREYYFIRGTESTAQCTSLSSSNPTLNRQ